MAKTKKSIFNTNISGASLIPGRILKDLVFDKYYRCPICGYPVNKNQYRCPNCGQPLRWSKN